MKLQWLHSVMPQPEPEPEPEFIPCIRIGPHSDAILLCRQQTVALFPSLCYFASDLDVWRQSSSFSVSLAFPSLSFMPSI